MSNIASGHGTSGDFFFGDGDTDVVPYTLGINVHSTGEVCDLSLEKFDRTADVELAGPTWFI